MFQRIAGTARRFLRETHAGATAFAAVGITVMTVGGAALIVDHNRLVGQRDILQAAADAASMSATLELGGLSTSLTDAEVEQRLMSVARKYAVLNVLANVRDPDLKAEDIQLALDIDRTARTVGATVQADIGRTLLSERLFGYSGPGSIATRSGVQSVSNPVEVVLAIDISQSMEYDLGGRRPRGGGDSRMDIVKQAAGDLVGILNPDELNRVAVGVVPWHIVVRLGAGAREEWSREDWAVYPSSRHYAAPYWCSPTNGCTPPGVDQNLPPAPGEAWNGCLDEQRIGGGSSHAELPSDADLLDLPGDSAFAQAFFPAPFGASYQCLRTPLPSDFRLQFCYDGAPPVHRWQYPKAAQHGCGDDVPSILPLTADRDAIEAAIDSLTPVGLRTYSTLGVAWGQRLLSHPWRDVWGDGVHPVDSDAEGNAGTRKAIVLLTDGEDNYCGSFDPPCANGVGIPRATACASAKQAGIEIFVVAAMHPDKVTGSLGTDLRACSSESDNPQGSYVFVDNTDPEALRMAFADIARQLRAVRRIY